MHKYLVWIDGTSRSRARPIEADTGKEAAEEFVRCHCAPSIESLDVKVLPLGAVQALLFTVDIEVEVFVSASLHSRVDAEREEEVVDG